jgi:hypothetical protein
MPPPSMAGAGYGYGGDVMAAQPMAQSYRTAAEDAEFVMGVPKAFPRWAIGAIIASIAVLLFVLGALFLK